MKKNIWMTILTIITVCCVVGGTFHYYGIFSFRGGFRFGGDRMTEASSDLDSFDAIYVDADLMDLTIETGKEFYLHSEYTDTIKMEYEVKDGKLHVKEKMPKKAWWGGMRNEQCRMTLTVPEGTAMESLEIKVAMGNISVEEITSSACDALTNMGSCTFKKCSFDKSDLKTNMGEITIKDTHLGDAEVDNDMGSIKIESCTFLTLNADNAMGDTAIDVNQNLDNFQIELEAGMGEVRVNGQKEGTKYRQSGDAGKLEASTSMGSVRLNYKNAE
ncbi:MAG: DUF4097 domain-containing protein [Lachnospiraceae bacterium]|nr:DUF4097 domain-containing protein [Lachnospiraceae bacterium]